MNKIRAIVILTAATCLWAGAGTAQDGPTAVVSIYHAAPGQQVPLLKWLARQDQIAAAAGTPAAQLYVHQDGADWDYVLIQPQTTEAQDAAYNAAARGSASTLVHAPASSFANTLLVTRTPSLEDLRRRPNI
jgi:hypothetical protein